MTKRHTLNPVRCLGVPPKSHLIGILVVKDEALGLPDVLRHHRALGVDRFAVIDNASRDGTPELLLSQPDVDLWFTDDPFSESQCGTHWRNRLASLYGFDRWYLLIDADELLVYSGMDRRDLHDVGDRLRSLGARVLRAPMIDMYPRAKLPRTDYSSGESLVEACPFFDGFGYHHVRNAVGKIVLAGGPRMRIMSKANDLFYHSLEKYPLLFWPDDLKLIDVHADPFGDADLPALGALLHFKFLADFRRKIDVAVSEKQYANGSREYLAYRRKYYALKAPFYAGSRRYECPESIVRAGAIQAFPW